MHYLVELDQSEEHKVHLAEDERGTWRVTVGEDESIALEIKGRDDDGAYVVVVDGEERRFHLDRDAANCYLTDDRDMVNVDVDPAGEVVLEHAETERRGELDLGTLESPITGVTLDVLVEPGDSVEQGDDVLIVEAMKMENTLCAPADGVIDRIEVEEGDRVFTGDDLLEIDRSE
ncbi:MAG: acetyl-CoA carboxylase biotin carboxyl carrier protein subunit [Bradymonadaceae bacterium]